MIRENGSKIFRGGRRGLKRKEVVFVASMVRSEKQKENKCKEGYCRSPEGKRVE